MEVQPKSLPRLQCIVLPFIAKSNGTALAALGGEERVVEALQSGSSSIRFTMPDCSGQTQLSSTVVPKKGLLVSVKRKRSDPSDVQTHVLGVVKSAHVFSQPFDFQFLPNSDDIRHYEAKFEESLKRRPVEDPLSAIQEGEQPPSSRQRSAADTDASPQDILEVTPQAMARSDYSKRAQFLSYVYNPRKPLKRTRGSVQADEESGGGSVSESGESESDDNEASKPRVRQYTVTEIIKFREPVPAQHREGLYPPRWQKKSKEFRGIVLIDAIRALLQQIPVLSRTQIIELLHLHHRLNLLKDCLPYAAFTYSNGPFSHLWVRYGYNPSEDSRSWIFQTLHCKYSAQYLQDLSSRLVQHIGKERTHRRTIDLDSLALKEGPHEFSHSFIDKGANARVPISAFSYLLKHQVAYQICSLHDDSAMDLVCKRLQRYSDSCDQLTGWFTPESAENFRSFLSKLVEKRVEAMLEMDDVPFDSALAGTSGSEGANVDLEARVQQIGAYLHENGAEAGLAGFSATARAILQWLKRYQTQAASSAPSAQSTTLSRPMPPLQLPSTQKSSRSRAATSEKHTQPLPSTQKVQGFDIFDNDTSDSEA